MLSFFFPEVEGPSYRVRKNPVKIEKIDTQMADTWRHLFHWHAKMPVAGGGIHGGENICTRRVAVCRTFDFSIILRNQRRTQEISRHGRK